MVLPDKQGAQIVMLVENLTASTFEARLSFRLRDEHFDGQSHIFHDTKPCSILGMHSVIGSYSWSEGRHKSESSSSFKSDDFVHPYNYHQPTQCTAAFSQASLPWPKTVIRAESEMMNTPRMAGSFGT